MFSVADESTGLMLRKFDFKGKGTVKAKLRDPGFESRLKILLAVYAVGDWLNFSHSSIFWYEYGYNGDILFKGLVSRFNKAGVCTYSSMI